MFPRDKKDVLKVSLSPVEVPKGVTDLRGPDIPIGLFSRKLPSGSKLFTISIRNRGNGTDRNVKVDVNLGQGGLQKLDIDNPERLSCIQGGKPTGSRAVL